MLFLDAGDFIDREKKKAKQKKCGHFPVVCYLNHLKNKTTKNIHNGSYTLKVSTVWWIKSLFFIRSRFRIFSFIFPKWLLIHEFINKKWEGLVFLHIVLMFVSQFFFIFFAKCCRYSFDATALQSLIGRDFDLLHVSSSFVKRKIAQMMRQVLRLQGCQICANRNEKK